MTKASSFFLELQRTNPKTHQSGWPHPRYCGDFIKSLPHCLAAAGGIMALEGRSDSLRRLHRNW